MGGDELNQGSHRQHLDLWFGTNLKLKERRWHCLPALEQACSGDLKQIWRWKSVNSTFSSFETKSVNEHLFICSIIMMVWKVIIAVWIWNMESRRRANLNLQLFKIIKGAILTIVILSNNDLIIDHKRNQNFKNKISQAKEKSKSEMSWSKITYTGDSENKSEMSRIKITYTRDPLQFCNIRDC